MEARCHREIVELHAFFEQWFRGEVEHGDAALARLADALAPGFEMITPEGGRAGRAQLLEGIRSMHGRHASTRPPFTIEIAHVQIRGLGDDVALATYEEWQQVEGERTERLSSAVFQASARAPNGVRWVHVHEVWLSR